MLDATGIADRHCTPPAVAAHARRIPSSIHCRYAPDVREAKPSCAPRVTLAACDPHAAFGLTRGASPRRRRGRCRRAARFGEYAGNSLARKPARYEADRRRAVHAASARNIPDAKVCNARRAATQGTRLFTLAASVARAVRVMAQSHRASNRVGRRDGRHDHPAPRRTDVMLDASAQRPPRFP
ncbi:hypothetical protein [Burkholderia oklahomensis]|nr:hypothetical protein [Burkholderia oklahomensis]